MEKDTQTKKNIGMFTGIIIAVIFFVALFMVGYLFRSGKQISEQIAEKPVPSVLGLPSAVEDAVVVQDTGYPRVYTHPEFGLVFYYPEGFHVGAFSEGEGEVVLLQDAEGRRGFQIFIVPYGEENPLSRDLILESAPEMKILNEKTTLLWEGNIAAFSFESASEPIGATQEVWFVYDNMLYQITAPINFAKEMEKIIQTIRFI